jgi:hypothetical protein
MERIYLKKRIGVQISRTVKILNDTEFPYGGFASWPLASLSMTEKNICIEVIFGLTIRIPYSKIDSINKRWYGIRIFHHDRKVKPIVIVSGLMSGLRLYRLMKEVNKRHRLGLKFAD